MPQEDGQSKHASTPNISTMMRINALINIGHIPARIEARVGIYMIQSIFGAPCQKVTVHMRRHFNNILHLTTGM